MNLSVGRVFDIAAMMVAITGLTIFLRAPNTSAIITATGNAFSGGLRAAQGMK